MTALALELEMFMLVLVVVYGSFLRSSTQNYSNMYYSVHESRHSIIGVWGSTRSKHVQSNGMFVNRDLVTEELCARKRPASNLLNVPETGIKHRGSRREEATIGSGCVFSSDLTLRVYARNHTCGNLCLLIAIQPHQDLSTL